MRRYFWRDWDVGFLVKKWGWGLEIGPSAAVRAEQSSILGLKTGILGVRLDTW